MKGNKLLKFSLLSISFLMMLRLTISPALVNIGEAVGKNVIEMQVMVVVASLFAIPFGFIASLLANKIKKRTIIIIALVLYIIGGMGPMLTTNFTFMLVCRAILGAGTGLFLPFAAGLLADFFKGEELNKMIGLQSATVSIGNIITSYLAGQLAAIDWRLAFLIYGFAVISFLLFVFNVPEPPKAEKAPEDKTINGRMIFILIAILVYAVIYFSYFGFISYVVTFNFFAGDFAKGAPIAGLCQMAMTAGSLVSGFIFAAVTKGLKKVALPLFILLNVIGFGIVAFAPTMAAIVIGSVVIGLGFGLLLPYGTMRIMEETSATGKSFANGMYMTFVNIGTAISPAILGGILAVFGKDQFTGGQFIWQVSAIALVVGFVISVILAIVIKTEKNK